MAFTCLRKAKIAASMQDTLSSSAIATLGGGKVFPVNFFFAVTQYNATKLQLFMNVFTKS